MNRGVVIHNVIRVCSRSYLLITKTREREGQLIESYRVLWCIETYIDFTTDAFRFSLLVLTVTGVQYKYPVRGSYDFTTPSDP